MSTCPDSLLIITFMCNIQTLALDLLCMSHISYWLHLCLNYNHPINTRKRNKIHRNENKKHDFHLAFCTTDWGRALTVAGGALNVPRQIFRGHGLRAARALAEHGPAVTFAEEVLREAGYLHDLRTRGRSPFGLSGRTTRTQTPLRGETSTCRHSTHRLSMGQCFQ